MDNVLMAIDGTYIDGMYIIFQKSCLRIQKKRIKNKKSAY